jgi:hypothetical protein
METSDYLMRQFNQLGKALGKLLADLFEPDNNLPAHQTLKNINQELITALDIDIETIIEIPSDELIAKFKEEYGANFANFEDLAEFLYQIGYLYQASNELNKATAVFRQALITHKYLLEHGDTFSLEIHQKINELEALLQ